MSLIGRASVALLSTALAVSLAAGASPARAVPAGSPAGHGATWLAGQPSKEGLIVNHAFTPAFNDYGLTADTALALTALGGHRSEVRKIRTALAHHVAGYTTGAEFGAPHDRYAGAIAKLLVTAQSTGARGRHFGGVNLVAQLAARVSTTAPVKGRIEDRSGFGDNANTIGQIFAVRGLLKAHHPRASSALRFLVLQQCDRGFFRVDFRKDKTAANQGCTRTSTPDADVTALAVVELWSYRSRSGALATSLGAAVHWLLHRQGDNGSFGGGGPTSAPNTNSTGLAGWALGTAGRCAAAHDAARWVGRRQVVGPVAGTPLAGERGAIAYNGAAMRAATSDGITRDTRDQWRRATAQAAPALRYLSTGYCRSH